MPAETPVNAPVVALTVAMVAFVELHVPPIGIAVAVNVVPWHSALAADKLSTVGSTVIWNVAEQWLPSW